MFFVIPKSLNLTFFIWVPDSSWCRSTSRKLCPHIVDAYIDGRSSRSTFDADAMVDLRPRLCVDNGHSVGRLLCSVKCTLRNQTTQFFIDRPCKGGLNVRVLLILCRSIKLLIDSSKAYPKLPTEHSFDMPLLLLLLSPLYCSLSYFLLLYFLSPIFLFVICEEQNSLESLELNMFCQISWKLDNPFASCGETKDFISKRNSILCWT